MVDFFGFVAVGSFVCVQALPGCLRMVLSFIHISVLSFVRLSVWTRHLLQAAPSAVLAGPAFSAFSSSALFAHKIKAGKLLPHLFVGSTCLLDPSHLELFGSF